MSASLQKATYHLFTVYKIRKYILFNMSAILVIKYKHEKQ